MQFSIQRIQWLIWAIIYLLLLAYTIRDQTRIVQGLISSTINVLTWALAIYCQSAYLLPRFWETSKRKYALMTVLCLIALIGTKMIVEYFFYYRLLHITHFYDLKWPHFSFALWIILLCMVIGFLLRNSLNYQSLQKKQRELENKQIISELNSLRIQVQPHFMFNTLNNIYSLATSQSEQTAPMIARLSNIMRYFVHEARMENVPFSVELDFIHSYMELEQMRMRYPIEIIVRNKINPANFMLPPMLFIPFIENYFKHGVDKTSKHNKVIIHFERNQHDLLFEMTNPIISQKQPAQSGAGIQNVKQRLELIYNNQFELRIQEKDNWYSVYLKLSLAV